MNNPYTRAPEFAFWRTAVAQRHALAIEGLWDPKHDLGPQHKIATAGSCFAQHLGRALRSRGYEWLEAEVAPPIPSDELKARYSYGQFSFRTGNIYTAALLKQWLFWALCDVKPPAEIWEEEGRFFDPFRPNIEPNGFVSVSELLASRAVTLGAIRKGIVEAEVFAFTMGLTEAWINKAGGYIYPMCPGAPRGTFDAALHEFRNFNYRDILRDMREAIKVMKSVNKAMRFLISVSPVPLTATATDNHVLVATTYSKSTLRAVAGDLAARKDVDYFPSYELITGLPFRSMFFEPNLRSVAPAGVEFVMSEFFGGLARKFPREGRPASDRALGEGAAPERGSVDRAEGVDCDDELLDAFGPRASE
jgi:hypothetical protein